jgi:hypothetical protein
MVFSLQCVTPTIVNLTFIISFQLAVGFFKVLLLGENQLESSAISYYNMQHLSYLYTIDLSRNQLTGFLRLTMTWAKKRN